MHDFNLLTIEGMCVGAIRLWEEQKTDAWYIDLPVYGYFDRRRNEVYTKPFFNHFITLFKNYSCRRLTLNQFSESLQLLWTSFVTDAPFFTNSEKKLFLEDEFLDATCSFICKFFDSNEQVSIEGLFQGLRNFWVSNILQKLFSLPVQYTDALYAYSMLYPYTDNLMDDPHQSTFEKTNACTVISNALQGAVSSNRTCSEVDSKLNRISSLIHIIFKANDISDHSAIRTSLIAIHRAQMESLSQQQVLLPYEVDLLTKSFMKGGTSLLADGAIIQPKLTPPQMAFCFHFGAILQLCDDLQDIVTDAAEDHQTLFSQLKDRYVLDALLKRIFAYTYSLKTQDYGFTDEIKDFLSEVIIKNTILLLVCASVMHQDQFSKAFSKTLASYLPVRSRFLSRQFSKLKNVLSKSDFDAPYLKHTLTFDASFSIKRSS